MKKFALAAALVSVMGLSACTGTNSSYYAVENGRTAGNETVQIERATPVVRRSADRTFNTSATK